MNAIPSSEIAILSRVIRPDRGDLPPQAAEAILQFDFDTEDRARMHELAQKNQTAELTNEEQMALESYRHVGRLLDLMRSKARLSLSRTAPGAE
jgi:hypothetical protein